MIKFIMALGETVLPEAGVNVGVGIAFSANAVPNPRSSIKPQKSKVNFFILMYFNFVLLSNPYVNSSQI